ncbi:MAG TPA: hypothetical protein VGC14_24935, partial [Rhizobium sp.]
RKDQTGNHQKAPLEPPRQSGLNQTVNRAANSNLHKPEKSQFIRRRAKPRPIYATALQAIVSIVSSIQ